MIMNLKNTKRLSWLMWGAALVALVPAMMGCQKRPADPASAQASDGARADATLHGCHFDPGGTPTSLNSLGEEKLELMLLADASLPMVVYLDVAKDETYAAREQAVRVYLKDRGLTEAQVTLVNGQNKYNTNPAAARLKAA